MFRFLPGIVLVQLITAALVVMAFQWAADLQLVIMVGLFALVVGVLTGFWFASIARALHGEALARMRDSHNAALVRVQEENARKREALRVDVEREKTAFLAHSYQRIERETRRAHARANIKVGVALTVAAGAGAAMLMTQFVNVGLMILVGSGSALSGYLMRARQERLARRQQAASDAVGRISGRDDGRLLGKE